MNYDMNSSKVNTELSKTGCYEFAADAFHCDFKHKLFLGHLGNHLLNAADFHSSDRGFGMRYLNIVNKTWVLSRLAIEMMEMPKEGETFVVETWVESVMKYFTNRNFRIVSVDGGKVYGYGRSVWALIDIVTRQPNDIMAVNDGEILKWMETEKDCPIEKGARVKIDKSAVRTSAIDTHYSDVDVNGHINSVKYIEHIFDLFPLEWYQTHVVERIDIAYVAESYYGDKLNFDVSEDNEQERSVRITKASADSEDEVEVCRAKIRFKMDNQERNSKN